MSMEILAKLPAHFRFFLNKTSTWALIDQGREVNHKAKNSLPCHISLDQNRDLQVVFLVYAVMVSYGECEGEIEIT